MTTFSEFQYEPVPVAGEETMGDKWAQGPRMKLWNLKVHVLIQFTSFWRVCNDIVAVRADSTKSAVMQSK